MEKNFILLLLLFVFLGCSKPGDCVESTGPIITKEYVLSNFEQITVYKGISLVLTSGPEYKVKVITGQNLINDIEIKVTNKMLSLKDNTTCNWVREYGQTTVYVTAPNITDIISKTEKSINSNGVLTYPILRLNSLDLTDGAGTGDFILQVNNNQTEIFNNNVSNFYIQGETDFMSANLYDGNGKIVAGNLIANKIEIFQRGTNDMILHPISSIKGNLYSTGNVICKNRPAIVEVNRFYQGQLFFY